MYEHYMQFRSWSFCAGRVFVHEIPAVKVVAPLAPAVAQIVHAIPDVLPVCHVLEQAIAHEIPEIQAVSCERVQQRTVEHVGSHFHAAPGTSRSAGAGVKSGVCAGYFFCIFPRPKRSAKVSGQSVPVLDARVLQRSDEDREHFVLVWFWV